jgi:hypothetical protein
MAQDVPEGFVEGAAHFYDALRVSDKAIVVEGKAGRLVIRTEMVNGRPTIVVREYTKIQRRDENVC